MKSILLLPVVAVWASRSVKYGPDGCVSLSLSTQGSCVIRTNCGKHDLNHFEFAFDCVRSPGEKIQTHSFGTGGFEAEEEFDTDVKCQKCTPPGGATQTSSVAAVARSTAEAAKSVLTESFGPGNCVKTWLGSDGTCMMKTSCKDENITGYEFGLLCTEPEGDIVRHLFGTGSFEAEEEFDTLIKCEACSALPASSASHPAHPAPVADTRSPMEKKVDGLAAEFGEMEKGLANITSNVNTLSASVTDLQKTDQVLKKELGMVPAPAPQAAATATPKAAPAAAAAAPATAAPVTAAPVTAAPTQAPPASMAIASAKTTSSTVVHSHKARRSHLRNGHRNHKSHSHHKRKHKHKVHRHVHRRHRDEDEDDDDANDDDDSRSRKQEDTDDADEQEQSYDEDADDQELVKDTIEDDNKDDWADDDDGNVGHEEAAEDDDDE